MALRKYFKTLKEARKAKEERDPKGWYDLHIWKMPKGTRKAGWFALCTEVEFVNTY